ncbi:MAG: 4Fe-4S binding protein [Deltaproteobacteria bacterium]|nr:4Fe-4S binding protein [Deltaproteobacteria bacterium]MBL7111575.1 4Fe-4S binding protein [Bacteroidales bacterium]
MNDCYKALAKKLDQIPNGYPATESGVELKLLAKLFTEEEAHLASMMSHKFETIQTISENNNLEQPEVKAMLVGMVKKGLIDMKKEDGVGITFGLIPFVVGFYEKQNARIDKEFAELFEAYYKEAFYMVMLAKPSVHRIIPVERTIPVNIDVMHYEKASSYIDEAKSWGVLDCICRVQQRLIGQGCGHPVENCLAFSPRPGHFDRTDDIRAISKEEALDILEEANKAGLVHSTNNAQNEVHYICNCCTCSCGVLRTMVDFGNEYSMARSDFYTRVDEDICSGCETCLDRCQFNALVMNNGICSVIETNCFGCGLCVTSCPEEALSMVQKNPKEIIPPPENNDAWREIRERERTKINS